MQEAVDNSKSNITLHLVSRNIICFIKYNKYIISEIKYLNHFLQPISPVIGDIELFIIKSEMKDKYTETKIPFIHYTSVYNHLLCGRHYAGSKGTVGSKQ